MLHMHKSMEHILMASWQILKHGDLQMKNVAHAASADDLFLNPSYPRGGHPNYRLEVLILNMKHRDKGRQKFHPSRLWPLTDRTWSGS